MKTLKTNNEMNYKALYESAMRRIAKLEEQLKDWQEYCTKIAKEDVKLEAKAELYEVLLCDAVECYEQLGDFDEIIAEFKALQEGKTTGYAYFDDDAKQSLTLTCFGIPKEEQTDSTQVIRGQIIDLLDEDDSDEVILALLPVLETNSEFDYYLPHDKDSLEYVFKNVFRNDLTAFTNWVASDEYSKSSYLNIIDSYQIICVTSLEVYEDLRCYIQTCPDEELDEMIAVLDELQLW